MNKDEKSINFVTKIWYSFMKKVNVAFTYVELCKTHEELQIIRNNLVDKNKGT